MKLSRCYVTTSQVWHRCGSVRGRIPLRALNESFYSGPPGNWCWWKHTAKFSIVVFKCLSVWYSLFTEQTSKHKRDMGDLELLLYGEMFLSIPRWIFIFLYLPSVTWNLPCCFEWPRFPSRHKVTPNVTKVLQDAETTVFIYYNPVAGPQAGPNPSEGRSWPTGR